jgi:NAD(P) transhydrogenase subunit beta
MKFQGMVIGVPIAEANIDYDKLLEMDQVNPRFPNTDLVLVVGSNDVVNPAARTAEGTPIYGMPVLDVVAAKNIIVCNYDTKPGYAGVDNPLYRPPRQYFYWETRIKHYSPCWIK